MIHQFIYPAGSAALQVVQRDMSAIVSAVGPGITAPGGLVESPNVGIRPFAVMNSKSILH